jgi:hypothetical protein
MTFEQFVEEHKIGFRFESIQERSGGSGNWEEGSSHWACYLNSPMSGTQAMRVEYSMGPGHRVWNKRKWFGGRLLPGERGEPGTRYQPPLRMTLHAEEIRNRLTEPTPPNVADVLQSLALDVLWLESDADSEGLDYKTGKALEVTRNDLIWLLGHVGLAVLLECEEEASG